MKTRKTQMKIFYEYPVCDECNMILTEDTDYIVMDITPRFAYICPKCMKRYITDVHYPIETYEPVASIPVVKK